MIPRPALIAVTQLALMVAVIVGYIMLARRFRGLWHPLSILIAVGIVGVSVSLIGEALFRGATANMTAMLRRSAIGSFGWGVVIAAAVWIYRRAAATFAGR